MVPDRSKSKGRSPSNKRKRKRKAVRKVAVPGRFNFDLKEVFGTDAVPVEGLTLTREGDVVAHFSVYTLFGTFAFVYNYSELPPQFTAAMKILVNDLFNPLTKREEAERKAGRRLHMPSLQKVLDSYSERAYETFIQRLPYEMRDVPYRLVMEILYALISDMERSGEVKFRNKYTLRKLWDGLIQIYGNSLKESWVELKPGPSATTSKVQRAEMLRYYNSVLPDCQSAKSIYKQNQKGPWRRLIKERQKLDKDDIENIIRLKPSEVALLITGKHFKRIIGKDFHGEAELRRQLGIARKEAATPNQDVTVRGTQT